MSEKELEYEVEQAKLWENDDGEKQWILPGAKDAEYLEVDEPIKLYPQSFRTGTLVIIKVPVNEEMDETTPGRERAKETHAGVPPPKAEEE